MFYRQLVCSVAASLSLMASYPSYADKHNTDENIHPALQDVHKPGTEIEFDADQDEVFEAVRQGYIRPFSELYTAVEKDLRGRIIKVELDEDDDVWIYELKLNFKNNIIKVEYNATTLDLLSMKGHNVKNAIKN
ncbi:PepSY domain-containing protein [Vibrio ostreicida]|uniref:PepSY domain-containing protein n=1 Tax=Vibrio ostreicida TaxID=526588 RepID=A0ABT8BRY6_9VIBR|nr:PepSY domain-containing protein [Vibrio ostreicida]MDN3609855.1 hypothetical protein [Vibrio ostreicida]NPD09977.1 hypothetical protein [Vibrio ostreicida]